MKTVILRKQTPINFLATMTLMLLFIANLNAQWTLSTEMGLPENRKDFCMIQLTNGDFYLFGGKDNLDEVFNDIYRLEGDNWKYLTPGPIKPPARANFVAWALGGNIHIFGGQGSGGSTLNDLWTYNPETNEWTEEEIEGTIPSPRYDHMAACTEDDVIFIVGGISSEGEQLSDTYKLVPGTPYQCEEVMSIPHPAYSQYSFAFDEDVALCIPETFNGGSKMYKLNLISELWESYDPPTNKPSFTTDAAFARKDNKIYKMGGYSYQSNRDKADFVITNAVWVYNFPTNTWEQETDMPFELMNAAAIYDSENDLIKVYGGVKADGSFNNEVLVCDLNGTSVNSNSVSGTGNILGQNIPNPFCTATTITYTLLNSSNVDITIYNIQGQIVDVVLNKWQEAGKYSIKWIPNSGNNNSVYYLCFKTNDGTLTKKMLQQK